MTVDKKMFVGLSVSAALLFCGGCKSRLNSGLASSERASPWFAEEATRINTECDRGLMDSPSRQWPARFYMGSTNSSDEKTPGPPIIHKDNYCQLWNLIKFVDQRDSNTQTSWVKKLYYLRLYIQKVDFNPKWRNPLMREAAVLYALDAEPSEPAWGPDRPPAPALPEEDQGPPLIPDAPSLPETIPVPADETLSDLKHEWEKWREPVDMASPAKICREARAKNLPAITYRLNSMAQPNLVRNLLIMAKLKFWDEQELRLGSIHRLFQDYIFAGLPLPNSEAGPSGSPFFVATDLSHTFDRRDTKRIADAPVTNEQSSGIPAIKHRLMPSIPGGDLVAFLYNPSAVETVQYLSGAYPFNIGISNVSGGYELTRGAKGSPIAIGEIDSSYAEKDRNTRLYDWRSYRQIKEQLMPGLTAQSKEDPRNPKGPKAPYYFMIGCTEIIQGPDEPWNLPGKEAPGN